MTQPVAPQLLSPDDLTKFQSSDPDWFLNAAGEIIRNFCQWHIAPSLTVSESVPIQPEGTIMLNTLHLTGVDSVSIDGVELDPDTYHWHQPGYIRRDTRMFFELPLWPLESDMPFREYPSAVAQHAEVTYTHGYSEIPAVVAAVGNALATRATELPAGLATEISAGPQTIRLGPLGLSLTEAERRALGPYILHRF